MHNRRGTRAGEIATRASIRASARARELAREGESKGATSRLKFLKPKFQSMEGVWFAFGPLRHPITRSWPRACARDKPSDAKRGRPSPVVRQRCRTAARKDNASAHPEETRHNLRQDRDARNAGASRVYESATSTRACRPPCREP
eukprot:6175742-Pleurochrysis_carterae.AAC.5